MQRTKQNRKPSAILTSDWHLREDTPLCWTGDFDEEQWNSVLFVKRLQVKFDCPVIHAGDLFDHWKPSPHLLTRTIKYLPNQFYTIYGQHDLPQHNLDLAIKSGVCTLETGGKLNVMSGWHYGQTPNEGEGGMLGPTGKIICVWHHMTYMIAPFPGATEGMATGILKKYPQFDLVVTGDNHQSFWTEYKGRLLVNPGSLTRQAADQIEFKPCVYLWYAEDNTVEAVYLPVMEGVISREHIIVQEQRNARIDAFISKIDSDWEVGISFEENLESFKSTNQIRPPVMEIVYKSIDNETSKSKKRN